MQISTIRFISLVLAVAFAVGLWFWAKKRGETFFGYVLFGGFLVTATTALFPQDAVAVRATYIEISVVVQQSSRRMSNGVCKDGYAEFSGKCYTYAEWRTVHLQTVGQ